MENLYKYRAVVRSIYDGDTVRLDIDLGFSMWIRNISVRLAYIDTPEIRGGERSEGLISKQYVVDKIPPGSDVIIETDKDSTGKYGRYLATIYYGKEKDINLNEELVSEGLAERYEK